MAVANEMASVPGSEGVVLEEHLVRVLGMVQAGCSDSASVLRSLVGIACHSGHIVDCPLGVLDTLAASYLALYRAHLLVLH